MYRFKDKKIEVIRKPGSVLNGHLSRTNISIYLKPPSEGKRAAYSLHLKMLLQVGFTRIVCHHTFCELLPHIFTLAKNTLY